MLHIAVFASGGGSNLQSLLDHFNARENPCARIALVLSDREDAGALDRARKAGVASRVVVVRGRPAENVARETLTVLGDAGIDIVALAGYLKLVPEAVVQHFRGRIVNIHPALLPSFGGKGMYGKHVHRAVLNAGCLVTGVTIHLVDERYDEGKPIAQWPVPVLRGDTPESLAARVLRVEHRLYPLALEALAVRVAGGTERVDGWMMREPVVFDWNDDNVPGDATLRRSLGLDLEET